MEGGGDEVGGTPSRAVALRVGVLLTSYDAVARGIRSFRCSCGEHRAGTACGYCTGAGWLPKGCCTGREPRAVPTACGNNRMVFGAGQGRVVWGGVCRGILEALASAWGQARFTPIQSRGPGRLRGARVGSGQCSTERQHRARRHPRRLRCIVPAGLGCPWQQ